MTATVTAPARAAAVPTATSSPPTTILLGSMPDLVRAGLEALLTPHRERITLRGRAERGLPDVEVFDPSYAGIGGGAPRYACPRIALVSHQTSLAEGRALALGAARMVPVSAGVHELIDAVEAVHRREIGRSRSFSASPLLSSREGDIVSGICRGLSNDEIARELFLSINSVKTYIRAAYRKMDVVRRSQAVLWGIEHGY